MVYNLFKLIRPHQWLKNLFIFLPLFFSGQLLRLDYIGIGCLVFLAYSLACSSIYCLNDILDRKADALHPVKKFRPIASGKLSVPAAWLLVIFLLLVSGGILWQMQPFIERKALFSAACLIGFYYGLNVCYCLWLKRIAVVDVLIIAFGFVLRILVGGTVMSIELSHWIVIMTFLLALFLAFAKRRDDVILYQKTGNKPRANIHRYNETFLNQVITVIVAVIIVAYIMYCVTPEVMERMNSQYVYATAVFVLSGLLRYLQLTIVDGKSGSPTKVLMTDHFLQLCIAGWMLSFVVIIYGI